MAYGNDVFPFTDYRVWIGVAVLCALAVAMVWGAKRARWILFALSWFLIALFPHTNIYPINAFMAEHWLYVPSIGLFAVFAAGLLRLNKIEGFQMVTKVLVFGALAFYSYLTVQQNKTWLEPLAFYERTLRFAPENSKVNNNIGILYNTMGKKEEAITRFEKAVASDPDYAEAYNNLGNMLKDTGKSGEAIPLFEKAIAIDPGYAEAFTNLGAAYYAVGQKDKAIASLRKSVALDPTFAEGHNNLAAIYYYNGEYGLAVSSYTKARELGLDNPGLSKLLEPYIQ
jgi:tetratricopeptide (TPR) repeat protein